MRGEQGTDSIVTASGNGSPPRARGAEPYPVTAGTSLGITPACAGSRRRPGGAGGRHGDHPRVRGEQSSLNRIVTCAFGSPPRARGAAALGARVQRGPGITPACAGSRGRPVKIDRSAWDHPRVRGEQDEYSQFFRTLGGSPPRARGAGRGCGGPDLGPGITPACAGSRRQRLERVHEPGDHPRVRGEQQWCRPQSGVLRGSPPRARGAGGAVTSGRRGRGITPACAGSRGSDPAARRADRDHPRVRGEQFCAASAASRPAGSPPRARGADSHRAAGGQLTGITPACAGSSSRRAATWGSAPDHPRVRGEQFADLRNHAHPMGSPPRARGAAETVASQVKPVRITPACAGSRPPAASTHRHPRDHPRVRGEQSVPGFGEEPVRGSPPRARGAGTDSRRRRGAGGITPACAGSSPLLLLPCEVSRDHPRVRGEQSACPHRLRTSEGSPPRARGAGSQRRRRCSPSGITPACAGSRRPARYWLPAMRDHPRVRGEQRLNATGSAELEGSPPRARGAGGQLGRCLGHRGITPACAGSRRTASRIRLAFAGSPPRARGAGVELHQRRHRRRITPACAGSRLPVLSAQSGSGDHPRVRGEQAHPVNPPGGGHGSPPRARGAATAGTNVPASPGITPACAGSRPA